MKSTQSIKKCTEGNKNVLENKKENVTTQSYCPNTR